MTIVVDASIAVAWLLPDEGGEAVDGVLDRIETEGAVTPSLFLHEVRNTLLVSERRKRLAMHVADALLVRLAKLPVRDSGCGDDGEVFRVARLYNLSAYDAAYLALALETGAPLATADRRLAVAAHAAGVSLIGPYAASP